MHYRLLGPLEVVRDSRPVDLGGPKQRAVLAVLLLDAGRVVPTDQLVEAVWGGDHPPSASGGLQAYISNLRRVLRDDATAASPIVRRPPGYLLDIAPEQIDLTQFQADADRAHAAVLARDWATATAAAEQALALWRGPLLTELQDEEWVRVAAAGLAERRTECVEDLITGLLGAGRGTQALGLARGLYTDQRLRERACWLYVVALYRAGRTAEALEVYRQHARALDDELGLDPGVALRDLQSAILRQDSDLLAWPGAAATSTPGVVEPDVGTHPAGGAHDGDATERDADALVGRAHELAAVDATLEQVRGGALRWLVLTGPAGIGKSRLAEEAVRRWERTGGRVIRAACPDDDGVPPWWPIRQLVRALGADPDAVFAPPSGIDADAARFAVYDRVRQQLTEAAEPLLVYVDDVQWADATSLRFLRHLASIPDEAALAVVLTAREGEGGDDLQRLLAAAARRPGTRQLAVPPLASAEVAELVNRVSGEAVGGEEAQLLTDRTGGNPFFVSEYARLPSEERAGGEIPSAVRSVLGRRVGALDAAVLQVLRTAAVIGEPFDIDLLRRVTRLDAEELADLLDEAADERIIVASAGSGSYTFAHGLLRDEVLASVSAVRRQRLHARVADALGPGGATDRLVRRAAHLVAALPLADAAEVFDACRAAALDAEAHWNSDSAAQWWAAALGVFDQLPAGAHGDVERDDLLVAQVSAHARAGRGQTVLDVLDAALLDAVRAGRSGSAGRLAAILLRTSGAWPWAVYGEDPGPLLARLASIEPLVRADPTAHARVLATLAVGSCYHPDSSVPDGYSRRAVELAEQAGDPDALADALLGRALTYSGVAERAQESVELLDRLAGLPHRQAQIDEVLRHGLMTMAAFTLGDVDAAEEHARLGVAGCDLLRLPVARAQFRWAEGMFAQWHGDLDAAKALYDQAYEMHLRTELYVGGVYELALLSWRWEQDRLDAAAPAEGVNPDLVVWMEAAIRAGRGEAAEAAQLIRAELARPEPTVWTTHGKWTMVAHLVADLQLPDLVPALVQRLEPVAGCVANMGQVGVVGPVALALARLHQLAGDEDAARSHVRTGLELARRGRSTTALARAQRLAAELALAG